MGHAEKCPPKGNKKYELYSTDIMTINTFLRSPQNLLAAMEHSHSDYEFLIPQTPLPFLTNDGVAYFGEVGMVFPVQSGMRHGIKYDIANISFDNIDIRQPYFEKMLAQKGKSGFVFCAAFCVSEELKLYLGAFKKEFLRGNERDDCKLSHLTWLICDELIELAGRTDADERRKNAGYQKGLRFAAEFINDNFERPITVSEAAAVCGLSTNYFSACFKKMFGATPFCYLQKLRISKAKVLLETTGDTLDRIAESCGFRHASSFSEAFSTVVGVTPGEYRQLEDREN